MSAKNGVNASRGVMILINNNFHCDIGQILTDPEGNFVIMELNRHTKKIILVSIYGSNDDKPNFYENILVPCDPMNDHLLYLGHYDLYFMLQ